MLIRGLLCPLILIFFCFSFYFPEYLFFVPYIFLITLLFYITCLSNKHIFLIGWFAGFIFFFIQMFGFLWVTILNGNGFVRIIYPLFLMAYCGIYTGVLFTVLKKLSHYLTWHRRVGWFLSLLVYTYIIDQVILFPFGKLEGYPLVFPLIPLVSISQSLHLILWTNKWILLCLFLVFQIYMYELFEKKLFKKVVASFILFFVCIFFIPSGSSTTNDWIKDIAFLPFPKKDTPYEMAHSICLSLIKAKSENRAVKLFVLPESAFPFVLNEHKYALHMWYENALQNDAKLIIGSHSKCNGNLYNSFLLVDQCRITECYTKSHLVPFFEYIPRWFQTFFSFKNLFISSKEPFLCGEFSNRCLTIDEISIVPCLCSELFFNSWKQVPLGIPFICLMNTSYFEGSGYSKVMLNYARFAAFVHKRSLAYIDSSSAYFITSKGYSNISNRKTIDFLLNN